MNEHRHEHPVQRMCRVLRVSSSGFYEWLSRPLSNHAIEDARLLVLIRASYAASGGVYGARRVHLDLRELGESCGKHRVARIMRVNKIRAIHGYKIPRGKYGRRSIIAPNKLHGSDEWQRFCCDHNLDPSMSRRGNCWERAACPWGTTLWQSHSLAI